MPSSLKLGVTLQLCPEGMPYSAPSILLPRVRIPSTPSTLSSFIVKFVLYLSSSYENNENKKEAGLAHLKKLLSSWTKTKTIGTQRVLQHWVFGLPGYSRFNIFISISLSPLFFSLLAHFCGQSYKPFAHVNYESRVVLIRKLPILQL